MKCFLIRDLLPFYAEGQVSKETKEIIEKHFKECAECRELYNSIINCNDELKGSIEYIDLESEKSQIQDREFWRKYYGSLIKNGIGLFFIVLILIIQIVRFIKFFK